METEAPKNYVSQMTIAYQKLADQNIIFGRESPLIISEIWNTLGEYPNKIKLNPLLLLMVYYIVNELSVQENYIPYVEKFLTYKSQFKSIFPKYNNLAELIDDFVRYLYIYFQSSL